MCAYQLRIALVARRVRQHADGPSPSSTRIDAIFCGLPSLALEEVFWHYISDEAVEHVRRALANTTDNNDGDDDDVADASNIRIFLEAYRDLRCAPEFCRAVRRLATAWPWMITQRFYPRQFAWRGVAPFDDSCSGSITCVWGRRLVGTTTAMVRIARVMARRVDRIIYLEIAHSHEPLPTLDASRERILDVSLVNTGSEFDALSGAMEYAQWRDPTHRILIVIDSLYCMSKSDAVPRLIRLANMGAHVIFTSVRLPSVSLVPYLDRAVWCGRCPRAHLDRTDIAAIESMGLDWTQLSKDLARSGVNSTDTIVFQRRRDGAWDVQAMPFCRPAA
jgi:hypothetical protein